MAYPRSLYALVRCLRALMADTPVKEVPSVVQLRVSSVLVRSSRYIQSDPSRRNADTDLADSLDRETLGIVCRQQGRFQLQLSRGNLEQSRSTLFGKDWLLRKLRYVAEIAEVHQETDESDPV